MNVTSPASASSWPRMILSRVDLPAPLGPTTAMRSPDWIVNETSSNNSRPPNDLESPATVSIFLLQRKDAKVLSRHRRHKENSLCDPGQVRLCVKFIWPRLSQKTPVVSSARRNDNSLLRGG